MDWTFFLKLFATPLGGLINKAIAIASTASVTWLAAKGLPLDSATAIVSDVALAASTAITVLAKTQGVLIPVVNAANNGVKVVPNSSPTPAVNAPIMHGGPHG